MRKSLFLFVPLALFLTGCATTDMQRIEKLEARVNTLEEKISTTTQEEAPQASETIVSTETTTVAPQETVAPESPTRKDIQAALKTANFYQGDVDGKFGPRTKKAVEDFQAANDLKPDGKVGPNTWEKLKKYYTPTETQETQTK
jgi:peptidoglycan hydrolase-like protein with peptidoglycan-binding domain